MPQQLIYTSAPRGIVAGRSGHCTVARSAVMREALMLQLEKLSYYQHLSLSGGREHPIFCCRIVDIRGTRFHVLSRIRDAGLDFTGRTNFIAHHLIFTPEEIRRFPTPPVILRDWTGWISAWTGEPQLLENEDWAALSALSGKTKVPAQTWQRVTGDAVNGYGLLETRAGASFRVDDQPEETVLELIAESLELLEVRDTRRDFRTAAWNFTFTTSIQEQDNPADFRWRCLHSDNPAASRLATPDCRSLSDVRAIKWTGEETAFARSGRQVPRLIVEPQDTRTSEGESARFTAEAEGIPIPTYQWFSVDRAGNGKILPGETSPELVVSNPAQGISRYLVKVFNNAGEVQSRVATLSVEQKLKLAQTKSNSRTHSTAKVAAYQKTEEDIERQRRRLEVEKAQEVFQKRQSLNKIFVAILAIILIAGAGVFAWHKWFSKKLPKTGQIISQPAVVNSPANSGNSSNIASSVIEPLEKQTSQDVANHLSAPASYRLPPGWEKMVIGNVTNASAEFIPSRFDLSAFANGFFTNGDNVLFVCKTNKEGGFKVSIPAINSTSTGRVCGIMMRVSQETNSSFLFIGVSLEKIFVCRRDGNGMFFSSDFEIPKINQGKIVFLKFDQLSVSYTPTYSFDNATWASFESLAFPDKQLLEGFALYSGDSSNKAIARFVELPPANESAN